MIDYWHTRQMVRIWHYMYLYLSKVESEHYVDFSWHDILVSIGLRSESLVSLVPEDDPLGFHI